MVELGKENEDSVDYRVTALLQRKSGVCVSNLLGCERKSVGLAFMFNNAVLVGHNAFGGE